MLVTSPAQPALPLISQLKQWPSVLRDARAVYIREHHLHNPVSRENPDTTQDFC